MECLEILTGFIENHPLETLGSLGFYAFAGDYLRKYVKEDLGDLRKRDFLKYFRKRNDMMQDNFNQNNKDIMPFSIKASIISIYLALGTMAFSVAVKEGPEIIKKYQKPACTTVIK